MTKHYNCPFFVQKTADEQSFLAGKLTYFFFPK